MCLIYQYSFSFLTYRVVGQDVQEGTKVQYIHNSPTEVLQEEGLDAVLLGKEEVVPSQYHQLHQAWLWFNK